MQLCGSLSILWHCLSLGLEWKLTFSSPVGHCWVFQICWHIECSTFTASSFRTWNSSTGIPSPPLALFVVMLPKAHLTSHSWMSGSRWVITPSWLSGSWRSFYLIRLIKKVYIISVFFFLNFWMYSFVLIFGNFCEHSKFVECAFFCLLKLSISPCFFLYTKTIVLSAWKFYLLCTYFIEMNVAQSCLTLCHPMYHTVHGILQARILEWTALLQGIFPTWGSNPGLPHGGGFFTSWATREAQESSWATREAQESWSG